MKAEEFIEKYGLDKAKEIISNNDNFYSWCVESNVYKERNKQLSYQKNQVIINDLIKELENIKYGKKLSFLERRKIRSNEDYNIL